MKKILLMLSVLLLCCLTACGGPSSGKVIEMPNGSEYYIGSEWNVDTLTDHFEELGFKNIKTVACEPDEDKFEKNIFELYIQTGTFSTDPWEAGEKFDAEAEISIYYNESPMLTVDNCPDLVTVLTSEEMDYMTFAEKYDGQYVEFEAIVSSHISYDGGTSHIIDVMGNRDSKGLVIRIGDNTWGNSIDESVEEGDEVVVRGKIDLSWCEYYNQLYVETEDLNRLR